MKSPLQSRFTPRSLELLSSYSREKLAGDIRAAVTVGFIALPLALALGVASVPFGARMPFPAPAIGLFTLGAKEAPRAWGFIGASGYGALES